MQPEKQPQSVLTPEAYNAVIDTLAPLDVRLVGLTFTLLAPVHSGPLSASASMHNPVISSRSSAPDGTHYALITQSTQFKISASDESLAAEGRAEFAVRIRLGFDPPDSFWAVFLLRNIKLYTHPALRDLIASLAARASLVVQPLGSVSVTQSVSPTGHDQSAMSEIPTPTRKTLPKKSLPKPK